MSIHSGWLYDELPTQRYKSVWKPLRHPVNQYPLAVCDGSTVPSDRLVEIDVVRKSYVGGIYNLLPSREYKWYFLDQHGPDEVLFMKMFDSSTQARAACRPILSLVFCSTVACPDDDFPIPTRLPTCGFQTRDSAWGWVP